MKDYIALYANLNDTDFINDSKMIDMLFDTKEITEKLNGITDFSNKLSHLFNYCFDACQCFLNYPYISNHQENNTAAEKYPELFIQCIFTTLATLENFRFHNYTIHINTLTADEYMSTNRLLSSCQRTKENNEIRYYGNTSVSYYNYQKAIKNFDKLINPSATANYVMCYNANFSKYVLENCYDNTYSLSALHKATNRLYKFLYKHSDQDNTINELSEKAYAELLSLLEDFFQQYTSELSNVKQNFLAKNGRSSGGNMGKDTFLFLYKINYLLQPDLMENIVFSVQNRTFAEHYNFFNQTYDALHTSCYFPFRTACLVNHPSLYNYKQAALKNDKEIFIPDLSRRKFTVPKIPPIELAISDNEYSNLYKNFFPIIKKLFFVVLLQDSSPASLFKEIIEYLDKQHIANIMRTSLNSCITKTNLFLNKKYSYSKEFFYDDIVALAMYIVRNFFSFSYSACLFTLDKKHINDYELLIHISPICEYPPAKKQTSKERLCYIYKGLQKINYQPHMDILFDTSEWKTLAKEVTKLLQSKKALSFHEKCIYEVKLQQLIQSIVLPHATDDNTIQNKL